MRRLSTLASERVRTERWVEETAAFSMDVRSQPQPYDLASTRVFLFYILFMSRGSRKQQQLFYLECSGLL